MALSLRNAAQELGVSCVTLRRWIHDGVGPRTFIKPGRRPCYRIRREELLKFIEKHSHGGK
jgi:excisionase family DNA binding protein